MTEVKSKRVRIAALIAVPLIIAGGAFAYGHKDRHHGGHTSEQRMEMHLSHLDRMLTKVGASESQRTQVEGLLKGAFTEMSATHDAHYAALGQFHELLLSPTIDRAKMEAVRAEQIRTLDEATKRVVTAFGAAAEALTAEQRAALAEEVRKYHGG